MAYRILRLSGRSSELQSGQRHRSFDDRRLLVFGNRSIRFRLCFYRNKRHYSWRTVFCDCLVDRPSYKPGKDIVVLTTAVCWYLGIVQFDSDYAFTVTNVIIHGVPYFAIVWFYAKAKRETAAKSYRLFSSNIVVFLSILWLLAYAEEILWHRSVWHEREWLFGAGWNFEDWKMYFVPLLALPQITHYVLDG